MMTTTNYSNHEYKTTTTALAAYLFHKGFKLLIIEYTDKPNGKQQATFVFETSTQLQEHVREYELGTATINVTLYEHAKTTLITRIKRGLP
jgi:hypothetical protein